MRRLAALVLVSTLAGASASAPSAANCSGASVPMTPLTDLGAAPYHGYRGGLYPGMKNTPSGPYLARGLAAARSVKPNGGTIVLLSIGMSDTTRECAQSQGEAHRAVRGRQRLRREVARGRRGGRAPEGASGGRLGPVPLDERNEGARRRPDMDVRRRPSPGRNASVGRRPAQGRRPARPLLR